VQVFLRSDTTRLIFSHLRAEDKQDFICNCLMEPILQIQNDILAQAAEEVTIGDCKVSNKQI